MAHLQVISKVEEITCDKCIWANQVDDERILCVQASGKRPKDHSCGTGEWMIKLGKDTKILNKNAAILKVRALEGKWQS